MDKKHYDSQIIEEQADAENNMRPRIPLDLVNFKHDIQGVVRVEPPLLNLKIANNLSIRNSSD